MKRRAFFGAVGALCVSPTLPAKSSPSSIPLVYGTKRVTGMINVLPGASTHSARQWRDGRLTIIGEKRPEIIWLGQGPRP